jgi:hypothetical protein
MITKEEAIIDLQEVYSKINKIPTVKEYRKEGKYNEKTIAKLFGGWNSALTEVLGGNNIITVPLIQLECSWCQTTFERKISNYDDTKEYFCSIKCSCIRNNKIKIDNSKPLETIKCRTCDTEVSKNRKVKHCKECIANGKHKKGACHITDNTLGMYRSRRNDASVYSPIRDHARKVNTKCECLVCGYSKHFDVCHVKDIKDFDDSATVGEINHPSNIIPLCKNHHWEFDNDEMEETDLNIIKDYLSRF